MRKCFETTINDHSEMNLHWFRKYSIQMRSSFWVLLLKVVQWWMWRYICLRLIEECWHENKAKRLTFRQILTRLDTVHNSMAHKRAERFLLSLNMCVCWWCTVLEWVTKILTLNFIWLPLKPAPSKNQPFLCWMASMLYFVPSGVNTFQFFSFSFSGLCE